MVRGWMKHEIFKDEPYSEREAWIWLIEEAAFRPRTKRIGAHAVQLERGQIATTLRFLAAAWGWQKDRVRRFLKRLTDDAMLRCSCGDNATPGATPNTTQKATSHTLITLCNYDDYQFPHETSATSGATPSETNSRQRRDNNATNENEVKELRKEDSPLVGSPEGDKRENGGSDDKPSRRKRGTRLPTDWRLTSQCNQYAIDRGYTGPQVEHLAEGFTSHHQAKAGTSHDWDASWRTWVNRDIDFHGPPDSRRKKHSRVDAGGGGFAASAARVVAKMEAGGNGMGRSAGIHGGRIGGGQGEGQGLARQDHDATASENAGPGIDEAECPDQTPAGRSS